MSFLDRCLTCSKLSRSILSSTLASVADWAAIVKVWTLEASRPLVLAAQPCTVDLRALYALYVVAVHLPTGICESLRSNRMS